MLKKYEAYYIWNAIKTGLYGIYIKWDYLLIVLNKDVLYIFALFLKNNHLLKYTSLLDIWGVDYPEREKRFEVNYLFLSFLFNKWIIVKITLAVGEEVVSLTNLFNSAGWFEWEVWDLYGVVFQKNNDLRRLLTDYGFEGHPMWKDFPLSGYLEVRYDDTEGRIVMEPIEFIQEYRVFNYLSPWEIKKN